ncbi:MAG: SGNH hydrolase domain-containing protein [Chloroflexota bacterium]
MRGRKVTGHGKPGGRLLVAAALGMLIWPAGGVAAAGTDGPRVAGPEHVTRARDSDGDGLTDAWELRYGLDPRARDTDHDGLHDPSEDPDHDGLGNLGEQRFHTDPNVADTDHDGVPDGREDADHDGRSNALEQDGLPLPARLRPSLAHAFDDRPAMFLQGCQALSDDVEPRTCAFGKLDSPTTVVVLGDSHGTMWVPALTQAATHQGWRLVTLTKSGCPANDLDPSFSNVRESCPTWRHKAEDWLLANPPSLVILVSAPRYGVHDPHGHPLSPKGAAAVWKAAYARTLAAMPPGVRVVVLGEVVHPRVDVPECLGTHPLMSGCVTRRAVGMHPGWAGAERAAVAAAGMTWDTLNPLVCPYDPCPVVTDGILMWRDSSHITRTFSFSLWPSAEALVERALAADPPPVGTLRPRRGRSSAG